MNETLSCLLCKQEVTATQPSGLTNICRECINDFDLIERHTIDQAALIRQAAFMAKYSGQPLGLHKGLPAPARPQTQRPAARPALLRLLGGRFAWGGKAL